MLAECVRMCKDIYINLDTARLCMNMQRGKHIFASRFINCTYFNVYFVTIWIWRLQGCSHEQVGRKMYVYLL